MGRLGRASHAAEIGRLYAATIAAAGLPAATLFGAAYKGIPLAALAAAALAEGKGQQYEGYRQVGFAYSRKEEKRHGEGGSTVGEIVSPVVVIDDILTAGTAARRTAALLGDARVTALVVAFDRCERIDAGDPDSADALSRIGSELGIRTLAIATASDLVAVLEDKGRNDEAGAIRRQLAEYGRPHRQ